MMCRDKASLVGGKASTLAFTFRNRAQRTTWIELLVDFGSYSLHTNCSAEDRVAGLGTSFSPKLWRRWRQCWNTFHAVLFPIPVKWLVVSHPVIENNYILTLFLVVPLKLQVSEDMRILVHFSQRWGSHNQRCHQMRWQHHSPELLCTAIFVLVCFLFSFPFSLVLSVLPFSFLFLSSWALSIAGFSGVSVRILESQKDTHIQHVWDVNLCHLVKHMHMQDMVKAAQQRWRLKPQVNYLNPLSPIVWVLVGFINN